MHGTRRMPISVYGLRRAVDHRRCGLSPHQLRARRRPLPHRVIQREARRRVAQVHIRPSAPATTRVVIRAAADVADAGDGVSVALRQRVHRGGPEAKSCGGSAHRAAQMIHAIVAATPRKNTKMKPMLCLPFRNDRNPAPSCRATVDDYPKHADRTRIVSRKWLAPFIGADGCATSPAESRDRHRRRSASQSDP